MELLHPLSTLPVVKLSFSHPPPIPTLKSPVTLLDFLRVAVCTCESFELFVVARYGPSTETTTRAGSSADPSVCARTEVGSS